MNDTKYTIVNGKLWHREGNYAVPDEEPIVVLRGKDPVALRLIAMYLECGPDESHRASMENNLRLFAEYQQKYPQRTRQGCHLHKEGE